MKRIGARNLLSCLLVALILFFLIRVIYKNWLQVKSFDFSFAWSSLLISFLILLGYLFFRVYIWMVMLHKMEASLSLRKCLKISFLSTMGKYLPGKVWLVLGKVYLAGKEGIPKPIALASAVLAPARDRCGCHIGSLHPLQTFPSVVLQVGQTQIALDKPLAQDIYVRRIHE